MKFSTKDFSRKYDQMRSFLRIWSHLLTKSLTENFISCTVIFEEELKEFSILSEFSSKVWKISEQFHNLCSSLNKTEKFFRGNF